MVKIARKMIVALFILGGPGLLCGEAIAQERLSKDTLPSISVTGEATVKVSPDQAQINIGVITQAQSAQTASAQNAQKLDATIAALRRVLGPGAEIKTVNYSLMPNYRYPREGGQPTIDGYTASNTVEVKTNDMTQVGKIIDAATQSGANNIQSLQFTLKDEQAVRAQALREASLKAKAKAEAIASALSLKVVRVLRIEESGQVRPIPMYARAEMAQAASAPTPIEPGTIEVQATVTLTVEIAQQ